MPDSTVTSAPRWGRRLSRTLRLVTVAELAALRPGLVATPAGAPFVLLRLPKAVVGPVGVVFESFLVLDDAHYAPHAWREAHWLPYVAQSEDRFGVDAVVSARVTGTSLYVDTVGSTNNVGLFLRHTVAYAGLQAELADAGVRAPALLPDWPDDFQAELSGEIFGATVQRPRTWTRVDRLLLTRRLVRTDDVEWRIPRHAFGRLARLPAGLEPQRGAAPTGAPLCLVDAPGGSEDDAVTDAERLELQRAGVRVVDLSSTSAPTLLSALAACPAVIARGDTALSFAIWANRHALCYELSTPGRGAPFAQSLASTAGLSRLTLEADEIVTHLQSHSGVRPRVEAIPVPPVRPGDTVVPGHSILPGDTTSDTLRARLSTWPELLERRPDLVAFPALSTYFRPRRLVGVAGDEAPRTALRVPEAVVGPIGVIVGDAIVVDDAHYMPHDWLDQDWLPFTLLGDGLVEMDVTVTSHIPGTALYTDVMAGKNSWGHFLHDSLTYAPVQRILAEQGVEAPALVPATWPYRSMRLLAGRMFDTTAVRPPGWFSVEHLLLPPRQYRLDPRFIRMPTASLRDIIASIPEADEARAEGAGPPVYLYREWGRFGTGIAVQGRHYTNGQEVDDTLESLGFLRLDPEVDDLVTILRAVARAPVIAGLHGSQMNHSLWGSPSAVTLEMTGPGGSNIANGAMLRSLGHVWETMAADDTPDGPTMPLDRLRTTLEGWLAGAGD